MCCIERIWCVEPSASLIERKLPDNLITVIFAAPFFISYYSSIPLKYAVSNFSLQTITKSTVPQVT